ncbi:unnamed protein product, partial [Phaeothamnion confervicola]
MGSNASRCCAASNAASAAVIMPSAPETLIVLAHGLAGGRGDLAYLEDSILRHGNGRCAVLNTEVNTGKTTDGVAAGGRRLAVDIRAEVIRRPSLQRLSIVGNSLGGLYVRYALRLLWDRQSATFAGLAPDTFMTTAAPHLGVRRFSWGVGSVPPALHGLGTALFGQSGRDLFMRDNFGAAKVRKVGQYTAEAAEAVEAEEEQDDESPPDAVDSASIELVDRTDVSSNPVGATDGKRGGRGNGSGGGISSEAVREPWEAQPGQPNPLLVRMATEREFLEPLAAFPRRRVYANYRGDAMVPRATAAIMLGPVQIRLETRHRPTTVEALFGRHHGLIVRLEEGGSPAAAAAAAGTAKIAPEAMLTAVEAAGAVASMTGEAAAGGGTWLCTARSGGETRSSESGTSATAVAPWMTPEEAAVPLLRDGMIMESTMAMHLNRLTWSKVLVDFAGLLPLNHNAIVAHSRTPISAYLNRAGKSTMEHATRFLLHEPEPDDCLVAVQEEGESFRLVS